MVVVVAVAVLKAVHQLPVLILGRFRAARMEQRMNFQAAKSLMEAMMPGLL
jgi:hypothetical protein